MRDWLYVDDHLEALLLAATRGRLGDSYCVGGSGERNSRQMVEAICTLMDQLRPQGVSHARLITLAGDRPGHNRCNNLIHIKLKRAGVAAPPHV